MPDRLDKLLAITQAYGEFIAQVRADRVKQAIVDRHRTSVRAGISRVRKTFAGIKPDRAANGTYFRADRLCWQPVSVFR